MSDQQIPTIAENEEPYTTGRRSMWVYYPEGFLRRVPTDMQRKGFLSEPPFPAGERNLVTRHIGEENVSQPVSEDSLYQDSFFFCSVRDLADLRGTGSIYVEVAVHPASGAVFATVQPAQNPLHAADLLTGQVLPHFEREGIAIERIFTRKTREYCGHPPVHAFETLLAVRHVEHVLLSETDHGALSFCADAYRMLQADFFSSVLRKKFRPSLAALQNELDAFLQRYNAQHRRP